MACPERVENVSGDSTDQSWYPYKCALTGAKISSEKSYKRCEYAFNYEECPAYKKEYK